MGYLLNPKILGATLVGLVLVGGAYVATEVGQADTLAHTAASENTNQPLKRVSIAVEDRDNNGIEDWRDAFITNEPIILTKSTEEYVPPDTITGKASIQLIRGLMEGRVYAPIAPSDEEVVEETIEDIRKSIETKTYTSRDIQLIDNWDEEDIVNYANTVAATIARHNIDINEHEIDIFADIVTNEKTERIPELEALAGVYSNYVTDTITIPVPAILAKQHLDLINSYQAVFEDINGMTIVFEDPIPSLAHAQRYLNSTAALRISLENIYTGLLPFAEYFTTDDPAVMFVLFSPDYQPNV